MKNKISPLWHQYANKLLKFMRLSADSPRIKMPQLTYALLEEGL